MIPDTKTSSPRNRDGTHRKMAPVGSHKEYIAQRWTRVESSSSVDDGSSVTGYYQVGFLWSWNFMLTKRWRSSSTGDEAFLDKMMADFRAFCSNKHDRLKEYWQSCLQEYHASIAEEFLEHEPSLTEEGQVIEANLIQTQQNADENDATEASWTL